MELSIFVTAFHLVCGSEVFNEENFKKKNKILIDSWMENWVQFKRRKIVESVLISS